MLPHRRLIREAGFGLLVLLGTAPNPVSSAGTATVAHDLSVTIEAASGQLRVADRLTLPPRMQAPQDRFRFRLNRALEASLAAGSRGELRRLSQDAAGGRAVYELNLPAGERQVKLRYAGRIEVGRDPGAGYIGAQGVTLGPRSGWYPDFDGALLRFSLRVMLPEGWRAVSQGRPQAPPPGFAALWVEENPQESLYLVAGPLHLTERRMGALRAQVFLRTPEDALADRYLAATEHYLRFYSRLLGPYPYAKFALVENFRETGYGMPSFTLLGSRVIRLPFIVHTSYPHEILHNWWGNGVFVDYRGGNWSEGLTTYLADHLARERRGEAAMYRRDVLQKYRNYVDRSDDFPLTAFVSRHGEASAAVGYNKTLMFFHMLRRRLGDARFIAGLRRLYREKRFTRADFDDIRRVFEAQSGPSLSAFFSQWVERVGAPALRSASVRSDESGGAHHVTGELRQVQAGAAYDLNVPIAVQTASGLVQDVVQMRGKTAFFDITVTARPLSVTIDPAFDVFRRLDTRETPAALGELLGTTPTSAVLPSLAGAQTRERYARLARQLGAQRIEMDGRIDALPATRAVWILGWDNRFRAPMGAALAGKNVTLSATEVRMGAGTHRRGTSCVVLAARSPGGAPRAWIGCDIAAAVPGLGRKLPHYSQWSFLAFNGAAPTIRARGRWRVDDSPLQTRFVPLADLPPLNVPATPMLDASAPP